MANYGFAQDLGPPIEELTPFPLDYVANDYHTEPVTFDDDNLHLIFGILAGVCCFVGITANTATSIYFFTRGSEKDPAICLLHKLISLTDLLVCVMLIPVSISNLRRSHHDSELIFSNQIFCDIWAFIWEITIRIAVFLIGMLSILRTTSLAIPLIRVRKRYIIVPLSLYSFFLSVQEVLPYFFDAKPHYYAIFASCGWDFDRIYSKFSSIYKVFFLFAVVVEFILPFLPIVISCVVSVCLLARRGECLMNCNKVALKVQEIKRDASVTIVILTVFYLVFNVPYITMWTLYTVNLFSNGEDNIFSRLKDLDTYYFISNMNLTYTIALNSSANPLVYIWRTKNLWDFIFGLRLGENNLISFLSFKRKLRRKTIISGVSGKDIKKLQKLYNKAAATPK